MQAILNLPVPLHPRPQVTGTEGMVGEVQRLMTEGFAIANSSPGHLDDLLTVGPLSLKLRGHREGRDGPGDRATMTEIVGLVRVDGWLRDNPIGEHSIELLLVSFHRNQVVLLLGTQSEPRLPFDNGGHPR